MPVVEYDHIRGNGIPRTVNELDKRYKKSKIYVSQRQRKPFPGVWKKVFNIKDDGKVYFVKTATLYGAHEIWKFVKDADKVILKYPER